MKTAIVLLPQNFPDYRISFHPTGPRQRAKFSKSAKSYDFRGWGLRVRDWGRCDRRAGVNFVTETKTKNRRGDPDPVLVVYDLGGV